MDVAVVKKVLQELEKAPASVNELASAVGIGWKTCEKYLEGLKITGTVEEIKTKNQRVFSLTKKKSRWMLPYRRRFDEELIWVRETP